MYEFTMKGLWVRWGALDTSSRRLFAGSMAAALAAVVPLPFQARFADRTPFYEYGYDLGYYMGSGGNWPDKVVTTPPALEAWAALWFIGFIILSCLLWWRLSVRQDELFNRIQNWAFAMGGVFSGTFLTVWSVLNLADIVSPATPLFIINSFVLPTCIFWFVAVRRWA